MRNIGSKLFVLLVLAAIVVGLGYAFVPEPVEVDLVTVERGDVQVTVDEDGKTRIREKYVVSAPLNGRILRISLDPGDTVVRRQDTAHDDRAPRSGAARCPHRGPGRSARESGRSSLRQAEPKLEEARAAQAFAESEADACSPGCASKADSASRTGDAEYELSSAQRGVAFGADRGRNLPVSSSNRPRPR